MEHAYTLIMNGYDTIVYNHMYFKYIFHGYCGPLLAVFGQFEKFQV